MNPQKMKWQSRFNQFDYSNKNYLTQHEYKAFCFSLYLLPKIKKEKISLENILKVHQKNENLNYKKYFLFLSDNQDFITVDTLKKANVHIKLNDDLEKMVYFFDDGGKIDYQTFLKIISEIIP